MTNERDGLVQVLGGGAAAALVERLSPGVEEVLDVAIMGDFGPVGGMRDRLLAGEDCDVIILSRGLIDALVASGHVVADSVADIGEVATGVAVRAGDPPVECSTPDSLRAALLGSDAIFCPDPVNATAGSHFAKIMRAMGIWDTVADRLQTYPGGLPAMRALAASPAQRPIGCTQITEIIVTDGVRLEGPLPLGCELVTTYTAAITTTARTPTAARALVSALTVPGTAKVRAEAGFFPA